jgi:Holliday junction resolvase RusA-like endonuclease
MAQRPHSAMRRGGSTDAQHFHSRAAGTAGEAKYTPKRSRDYRSMLVSEIASKASSGLVRRFEKGTLVKLSVLFKMQHRSKSGVWHGVRGDADNLAKQVCDALVDAGILHDDGQIVILIVKKVYGGQDPGVLIELSEVTSDDCSAIC